MNSCGLSIHIQIFGVYVGVMDFFVYVNPNLSCISYWSFKKKNSLCLIFKGSFCVVN